MSKQRRASKPPKDASTLTAREGVAVRPAAQKKHPANAHVVGRLRLEWLAAAVLLLAGGMAYSNSLHGPFIFDDEFNIVKNESIRRLWPLDDVLLVRSASAVGLFGRPVVNLSLALNYAAGRLDPFSYHLANVAIHLIAGLLLFGLVRRTLLLPRPAARFGGAATGLALVIALLWTVHPLQTAAVTYVIQRCESLMGMFFLAAMYTFVRGATSAKPRIWWAVTVIAALLAFGSKEVAIALPFCILMYDRAFLSCSFRAAWQQRRGLYCALLVASVAFLVFQGFAMGRNKSAGFGIKVSVAEYVVTQPGVILHYLRLAIWPQPLVLDYDWPVARSIGEILPGMVVIGGLLAATIYALIRRPAWAFVGAWFFLILAPSSSVLPIADLAFEHRMYLPLAAVVAVIALSLYLLVQRWRENKRFSATTAGLIGGAAVMVAFVALVLVARQRNELYQSRVAIWRDTVEKAPNNARARQYLGSALVDSGDLRGAIDQFQAALEIRPGDAETHNTLGAALKYNGDLVGAEKEYRKAIQLNHNFAEAYNNLGDLAVKQNDADAAFDFYNKAIEINPDYAEAHNNLGNVYYIRGNLRAASDQFQRAMKLRPDLAEPHNGLGSVLFRRGDMTGAIEQFEKALERKPGDPLALQNLDEAQQRQWDLLLRVKQRN